MGELVRESGNGESVPVGVLCVRVCVCVGVHLLWFNVFAVSVRRS